jgi:hypothetical protein
VDTDFDFLWWLGRYVGTWRSNGVTYQVSRRRDGWLEAEQFPDYTQVPLSAALREAIKVEEPPGPLGPRPIELSAALMELWLTPEDLGRLRGAVHVGTGLTRILERIELRIAELDEPEQKRRWSLWWSGAASAGPDKRDMAYLDALRADYERANPRRDSTDAAANEGGTHR